MVRQNKHLGIQILVALTLAVLGNATLAVYNMQALGENVPELLNISYSIANFGFAPYSTQQFRYGKTIIARLMHSPDFSNECLIGSPTDNYCMNLTIQRILSC